MAKTELDYGDKIKLDGKDKKVIEQLQTDASQSISQIARKTKLARNVVKYRIKRLKDNGVIRFYHAFLNPAKLGYPLYSYVIFSMSNISLEEEKKFVSYLTAHKNIVYVAKNSGKIDFTIGVLSRDYSEFDGILQDIRRHFSDLIKDYDVTPVVQEYKMLYMADLV